MTLTQLYDDDLPAPSWRGAKTTASLHTADELELTSLNRRHLEQPISAGNVYLSARDAAASHNKQSASVISGVDAGAVAMTTTAVSSARVVYPTAIIST